VGEFHPKFNSTKKRKEKSRKEKRKAGIKPLRNFALTFPPFA
jgi:hypothetical protein